MDRSDKIYYFLAICMDINTILNIYCIYEKYISGNKIFEQFLFDVDIFFLFFSFCLTFENIYIDITATVQRRFN